MIQVCTEYALGKYREQHITVLWKVTREGKGYRKQIWGKISDVWAESLWMMRKYEENRGKMLKAFQAEETMCNKQESKRKWLFGESVWCKWKKHGSYLNTDYVGTSPAGFVRLVKGSELPLRARENPGKVLRNILFLYLHFRKTPLTAQLKIDWKRAWLEAEKQIRRQL